MTELLQSTALPRPSRDPARTDISACYVAAKVPVVRFSNLAWANNELSRLIPAKLGCVPMPGEPSTLYKRNSFVAGQLEMYGGAGVGANAGGVRCLNIQGCQVKGVGPSVLAGRTTDKWHKHGALSLQDAIKETIFSELVDCATPHGASRAIGIAPLGVYFSTEIGDEKKPGRAPRALFLREPIVRLGHFLRATFANVDQDVRRLELPRMRSVISALCDLSSGPGNVTFTNVIHGVEELFRAVMEQFAAMRLGRVVHGSPIPSNIGLDGRLVDFTTSTFVSGYQSIMVSLGGSCSRTQHLQALDCLFDLLFYISKFDKRCANTPEEVVQCAEAMRIRLITHYQNFLENGYLRLLGFSGHLGQLLPEDLRIELAGAVSELMQQGRADTCLYFGGDEHPMPEATGRDGLPSALVAVALSYLHPDTGWCDQLADLCDGYPPHSLRRVQSAYGAALNALDSTQCGIENLAMSQSLRVLRVNSDLSPLYRRNIDGEINDLCESTGDVGTFIDQKLRRWRNAVRWQKADNISLNGWLTDTAATLNDKGALFVNGNAAPMAFILQKLRRPANAIEKLNHDLLVNHLKS